MLTAYREARLPQRPLRQIFEEAKRPVSKPCLDLISGMLKLNPNQRFSASAALTHPYLTSEQPAPCLPEELPRVEGEISQKFVHK